MEAYSVLMSVYQKEKAEYFRKSAESMLNQTVSTDDFVIVCDGPLTKELDAVIEDLTKGHPGLFQIVRKKQQEGLGKALCVGLGFCRNDLVARMDSDDVSVPDRCEKQLAVFAADNAELVGGSVTEFMDNISDAEKVRRVPQTNEEIRQFAKRRNPFNHPTVMFRKSAVLKAGNYMDCQGFEDYYLWVRMLGCGMRGYNLQETLVYMRTGEGMYRRRGSFAYALLGIKARWKIYKTGYSGFFDFLVSAGAQLFMSLVPVKLRARFYGKFLRDQKSVSN